MKATVYKIWTFECLHFFPRRQLKEITMTSKEVETMKVVYTFVWYKCQSGQNYLSNYTQQELKNNNNVKNGWVCFLPNIFMVYIFFL